MLDNNSPKRPVKLMFIHHSCGKNWLEDDNGGLGVMLSKNNYFVSDTYYGWGPDKIGNLTDTGHWWLWFRGENNKLYTDMVYKENKQSSTYSRMEEEPSGENEIIMFKSCYPNSNLKGSPTEPIPDIAKNPLRGLNCDSEHHTISNSKGIYIDLFEYFKMRQDKLFVTVTAPPVSNADWSANARLFNNWLVNEWLKEYPYKNVCIFDFYNVLTSSKVSNEVDDVGLEGGNHHRIWNGKIQHVTGEDCNINRYPSNEGDDHPSIAGNVKATAEFINLLNYFYNEWMIG